MRVREDVLRATFAHWTGGGYSFSNEKTIAVATSTHSTSISNIAALESELASDVLNLFDICGNDITL